VFQVRNRRQSSFFNIDLLVSKELVHLSAYPDLVLVLRLGILHEMGIVPRAVVQPQPVASSRKGRHSSEFDIYASESEGDQRSRSTAVQRQSLAPFVPSRNQRETRSMKSRQAPSGRKAAKRHRSPSTEDEGQQEQDEANEEPETEVTSGGTSQGVMVTVPEARLAAMEKRIVSTISYSFIPCCIFTSCPIDCLGEDSKEMTDELQGTPICPVSE